MLPPQDSSPKAHLHTAIGLTAPREVRGRGEEMSGSRTVCGCLERPIRGARLRRSLARGLAVLCGGLKTSSEAPKRPRGSKLNGLGPHRVSNVTHTQPTSLLLACSSLMALCQAGASKLLWSF